MRTKSSSLHFSRILGLLTALSRKSRIGLNEEDWKYLEDASMDPRYLKKARSITIWEESGGIGKIGPPARPRGSEVHGAHARA